jgi:hypothetical protein
LLETRIAPTLHLKLYGFNAREDFSQTIRYGGYRPTVFLEHGLWVGVWMMAAALIGVWLWKTKVIKKFKEIPVGRLLVGLLVTVILVKSTGAYLYLLMGIVILFIAGWQRTQSRSNFGRRSVVLPLPGSFWKSLYDSSSCFICE